MRLYYIQPLIAGYRIPIINTFKSAHDITVVASISSDVFLEGFKNEQITNVKTIDSPVLSFFNRKVSIQKNVSFLSLKQTDAVLSFADPRFISFWVLLFRCFIFNKKFYSHGQGLYSYPNPGFIRVLIYRLMVSLSRKYICYSEISRQSLLEIGCDKSKLVVAENSLSLQHIVPPSGKKGNEKGVLFIGRLRDGCRLDLLVEAVHKLRDSGENIILHIIGSGMLDMKYRKDFSNYNWIIWHGPIHNDQHIAQISKECRVGCYPGDAGLSVVHLFGLSLPPIIHDNIYNHMGPEPSYVQDNVNGFLFNENNGVESLYLRLKYVWSLNKDELNSIVMSAFNYYVKLNQPPLGIKFLEILKD